jgi:ABC-2 type transport system permease protein
MNEPQGELYDLGYQHYDGPREGRSRGRKAIFWNGVRTVLGLGRGPKAKILPLLMFTSAMLPALIFAVIFAILGPLDDFAGPAEYYGLISFILFIFSAMTAPDLIIPDRRERVIDLYLVRPISATDYIVGRSLAFFVVVLALVYSGQVILQVGLILGASSPWDHVQENWLDIPRFLGAGALIALFITVVPLAVASFTNRRAVASAFVIGLFFISFMVVQPLTANSCGPDQRGVEGCDPVTGDASKWFSLLSVWDTPLRVSNMVFDHEDGSPSMVASQELHNSIPLAAYGLTVLALGSTLWWQYRRIVL